MYYNKANAEMAMQPFLDSDMQSRYFEFGEDTIVRADQYGFSLSIDLQDFRLRLAFAGTFDSHLTVRRNRDGFSRGCL